ncbi:MAG: hypothetical protein Q7O66_02605 [Dehalococcoidia bacterium]|nr:hypothetical protein [Dehalococcoidia bacterium]
MKFRLFWLLSLLCPLIPRRIGCKVAGFLGYLAYYLVPGARSVVQANLRVVLGANASTTKVNLLAGRVFRNAAKNYFDLFWLRRLDLGGFGSLVRVEGADNLQGAIDAGKGVVVITAHLGNFDICGQEIAAKSLDMTILLEHIEPPQLLDLVLKLRASKGVKFVPVGPSVLKEALRALKRGGAVGVACDRDIQRSGLKTAFFGQVASLPQGAAHMAVRTGAMMVPAFSERLPDESFVIYIDPVMKVDRTDNAAADTEAAMAMIVCAMEKRIGANPGQWVVFERIWPGGH